MVHLNNAKCFTTAQKNIMHVYIDHQPTVTSSHSSNNTFFMLSVNMNALHDNENVWVSMGQKKLFIFIHDGCTEPVLPLF